MDGLERMLIEKTSKSSTQSLSFIKITSKEELMEYVPIHDEMDYLI